ncbi:lipoprotein [Salmonella enterica subsp. enterica serovar Typhi]|nr:lipoprotein [Salmonella enterica subsp. enterica serovar Typhi]
MGLRQSLRIAASTLLLACGLQFAHADGSPQTIVFGVAPGPYGDMVKQAIAPTLKEKGYKVVVREFSDYVQPKKKKGIRSWCASLATMSSPIWR